MAQAKAQPKTQAKASPRTRSGRKTASSPDKLRSFNPRTGEVMAEIPTTPIAEVAEIVARARKVQPEWGAIGPEGRARMLREVRYRMYERLDDIVKTVSAETGKSEREALLFDGFAAINLIAYMERVGAKALRPKKIGRVAGPLLFGSSSHVEWRPFGVVGAITPWNYPITNCLLAFV
ncbi:MAG: hypothetical protein QOH26_786, partial [Actinomycetota bacterium]|nr:hypothetical protein [Actinomycetota bacterium]